MTQNPQFLTLLTSKRASRHNSVYFFDVELPSNRQKAVPTPGALYILTWTCASRRKRVHFFDVATFKSGPDRTCFDTFYFQMCFAPQRRALFPHLNFQKLSENGVFALTLFTSKCAWRHSGVHFLISHLASWLCTHRFSQPTFRPPEPQNTGKTLCFATSLPFRAPASTLF